MSSQDSTEESIDALYASTFAQNEETPASETEPANAVKFSFEEDFQQKIAALFVRDVRFAKQTYGLIKPEYFDSQARGLLFSIFSDHFELYRTIPTDIATIKAVLKDGLGKRRAREETRKEVAAEFRTLRGVSLSNGDFVATKVSEFARHQALQNFFMDGLDLLQEGNHERILSTFENIKKIGRSDVVSEIDYWGDIDRRTELRKQKLAGTAIPTGITTGIKNLDKHLYNSGWGRKELSCIMGGAKRGKSTALGHFSVAASRNGYNALYVTLEVSSDIITERMDANVTKTAMYDLEDNMMTVKSQVEVLAAQKNRGALKVVEYPTGSLSPSGLRRLIERYRNEGLIFDLIVVDYADIMRPDHITKDPIENSKQVWIDLRAIAGEENAALLTATQTNRTGFKQDTAKAEDVAEDFNKVRIADILISINRTDEERDKGEARLFIAASRNGQGEMTLKIKQDMPSMQFITEVTDVR